MVGDVSRFAVQELAFNRVISGLTHTPIFYNYFGGLRTTPSYCLDAMLSRLCLKCRLLLSIFDESCWPMFEWMSSIRPLMYLVVT